MTIHKGVKYYCEQFGKECWNTNKLKRHLRSTFESSNEITYNYRKITFEEWPKNVKSKLSLKLHIHSHDWLKPYTCEKCGKAYGSMYTPQWHMEIQIRLKPYVKQKVTRYVHVGKHHKDV